MTLSLMQPGSFSAPMPRLASEPVSQSHSNSSDLASTARIAIIDDEPINIKVVRKHLQVAGYENFITSSDSPSAMRLLAAERPDVVLLDIMMPVVDGIQILSEIRTDPILRHTPVLILTASTDAVTKSRALNAGATDFLAKPVDPSDLLPRIRNTLIVKAHQDHLSRYSDELERQVRARTAELELSRMQVIFCLARAGECRDDTTGRHVIRVGRYASVLAREMGYSETDAATLGLAAQLHDIGKIGLPDAILLKPGKLTPEEFNKVKTHCDIGNQIVQPLSDEEWRSLKHYAETDFGFDTPSRDPLLMLIANITLCHHEKWDGSGYPRGLAGEKIPMEGRITSVADVFDALTSVRPYKAAFTTEECIGIMEKGRGTQFDPKVLDAMLKRLDDLLAIRKDHADPVAA